MSRPSTLPTWATDANYPAGAQAWASTATKVEPTSGQKAQGAEPQVGFGAQAFNWLLNNLASWVGFFDDSVGVNFFGDGSDGDVSLDGSVAAPSWASKSGSVYTMTRDAYCDDLTLSSTAEIYTAGFRLFVKGTLTIGASAKVQCNGFPGSGTTGGNASASTGSLSNGSAGGAGGVSGNVDGDAGGNLTACLGGLGGTGGLGDTTGSSLPGSAGGSVTAPTAANGGARSQHAYTTGHLLGAGNNTAIRGGTGGGGGHAGNDGVSGSSNGGGGGGGGGVMVVCARRIALAGSIEAKGAAGGNATLDTGTGFTGGGGGGGGGGVIFIVYQAKTGAGSISVAGGTGGTQHAGGGNGNAGASGSLFEWNLGA